MCLAVKMTKDLKILLVFVGLLALSVLLILSFELSLSVKNLPKFAAGRTMMVSVVSLLTSYANANNFTGIRKTVNDL